MRQRPLVTVVIVGYNQGEYVAEAIDSALAQTYAPLEVVAIDNGSTDGSREVMSRYADRPNVRLRLHADGATVTRRMNEGVAAARGEFVSFLYADDFYLPEKIERQVAVFAGLPDDYGVAYATGYRRNVLTGETWIAPTPRWSGWVLRQMLDDYFRAYPDMDSPLVRRACYVRYPFHEDVFAEGEAVFMRIAIGYRFQAMTDPLVVMREHRTNLGKAYEKNALIALTLFDRLEREDGFPASLRGRVDGIRAKTMRNLGWQLLRLAADGPRARGYLLRSLEWGALRAAHPRFLAGLALSMLPAPVMRRLNAAANRVKRHRENLDVVTTLGPGSE